MSNEIVKNFEPEIQKLILAIKYVQKKMKEMNFTKSDFQDSDKYIEAYTSIADDEMISWFADGHPELYKLVIKGADYDTISQILFYYDQVKKGKVNEKQLAEFLHNVHVK